MKKKSNLILCFVAAVVLIAGLLTGLSIKKRISDRTVNIAFYGVSDELCSAIKAYLPEIEKVQINIDNLASGNVDLGVVSKKYDLLFCWKGDVSDSFAGGVESVPSKLADNLPVSLRNKYFLPLLLDHFEINLYSQVVEKSSLQPQTDYASYMNYLETARNYVFTPFFTNGGDDRTLLALTGSIVEAQCGLAAYNNLVTAMRKSSSLNDFIDVELAPDYSFRSVLDLLKSWPKNELVHPQWFMATASDLALYAEENQVAAFYTTLSRHRSINYRIVSKFDTIRYPVVSADVDHGIIAPALGCVMISDNVYLESILKPLISADNQTSLSELTMLAPVQYRAEAYDVQADDVRFWAAACAGGALPDLSLAVYQRKPDLLRTVAGEIRTYLKN